MTAVLVRFLLPNNAGKGIAIGDPSSLRASRVREGRSTEAVPIVTTLAPSERAAGELHVRFEDLRVSWAGLGTSVRRRRAALTASLLSVAVLFSMASPASAITYDVLFTGTGFIPTGSITFTSIGDPFPSAYSFAVTAGADLGPRVRGPRSIPLPQHPLERAHPGRRNYQVSGLGGRG